MTILVAAITLIEATGSAAGAVFTGTYMLPAKGGTSFITIRSAAPDASLPAAGARIDPSYAWALPKITSLPAR